MPHKLWDVQSSTQSVKLAGYVVKERAIKKGIKLEHTIARVLIHSMRPEKLEMQPTSMKSSALDFKSSKALSPRRRSTWARAALNTGVCRL